MEILVLVLKLKTGSATFELAAKLLSYQIYIVHLYIMNIDLFPLFYNQFSNNTACKVIFHGSQLYS